MGLEIVDALAARIYELSVPVATGQVLEVWGLLRRRCLEPPPEGVKTPHAIPGRLQRSCREVQRSPVVRSDDKESECPYIVFGGTALSECEEVSLGLGHFLLVDVDKAIVHPVAAKGLATRTFRLGDLVLVMREDQIDPTGMDVDGVPQERFCHGTALNVPTRTTTAPRAIPPDVSVLLFVCLPQGEILRLHFASPGSISMVRRDLLRLLRR
mmetsp:Transcript_8943/g.21943  ORF Transcript_8943/g.21943 Transcript_8943/m.21943 type:complete len:212 (-) Transcript_8943:887-1522(-)